LRLVPKQSGTSQSKENMGRGEERLFFCHNAHPSPYFLLRSSEVSYEMRDKSLRLVIFPAGHVGRHLHTLVRVSYGKS
ncbi:hypothetical protein Bpfe_013988, partial [Biomphalaria pfeifferi]